MGGTRIKREGSNQGKGWQKEKSGRREPGWEWEIIKRERKDTDFQRIGKRGGGHGGRCVRQRGAREGGHLGILGSRRMPGDHKQPLSLKEDLKSPHWRQFSAHPNNPLTH